MNIGKWAVQVVQPGESRLYRPPRHAPDRPRDIDEGLETDAKMEADAQTGWMRSP